MRKRLLDPVIQQSAGGVVFNRRGQVLVVNQHGNSWSLPKGHLDGGESALDAARREIREESGVRQLTLVADLGEYRRFKIGKRGGQDRRVQKSITLFLFKTRELRLKPVDADNPEARWVEPEKVVRLLTHPKDKAFFRAFLRRRRKGEFPL